VRSAEELEPLRSEEREHQRRAQRRAMLASPFAITFDVPTPNVGSIIGKGGKKLAQLEQSTGAAISFEVPHAEAMAEARAAAYGTQVPKSEKLMRTVRIAGASDAMRAAKEAVAMQLSGKAW
jgi:predicted PilT family ATPase